MCDVSDGLLSDLGHIAAASQVIIDVHTKALTVPEPLQAVAAATGVDALRFVLTGGEDHALVGTFEPADVPEGWTVIGSVAEGNEEQPAGTVKAWNAGSLIREPGYLKNDFKKSSRNWRPIRKRRAALVWGWPSSSKSSKRTAERSPSKARSAKARSFALRCPIRIRVTAGSRYRLKF